MDIPTGIPTVVGVILWAAFGGIFLYRLLLKDRRDSRRRDSEAMTRTTDITEPDFGELVDKVESKVRDALTEYSLLQDNKLLQFRVDLKDDIERLLSRYYKVVPRRG